MHSVFFYFSPLPGMCPASKAVSGMWQAVSEYLSDKCTFKKIFGLLLSHLYHRLPVRTSLIFTITIFKITYHLLERSQTFKTIESCKSPMRNGKAVIPQRQENSYLLLTAYLFPDKSQALRIQASWGGVRGRHFLPD